jgi:hypothetical protein
VVDPLRVNNQLSDEAITTMVMESYTLFRHSAAGKSDQMGTTNLITNKINKAKHQYATCLLQ